MNAAPVEPFMSAEERELVEELRALAIRGAQHLADVLAHAAREPEGSAASLPHRVAHRLWARKRDRLKEWDRMLPAGPPPDPLVSLVANQVVQRAARRRP